MAQNMGPEARAQRERQDRLKAFRAETEGAALRVARLRFGNRQSSRNGHDPEDAVNDAYYYFDQKNYIDEPPEKHRSLLFKIVHGKAMDMVKYERRTSQIPDDHHDIVGSDDQGFDRSDEEDAAASTLAQATSVLDDLKPRQRDILDRFYVGEQSTAEIGQALGITDRAVRLSLEKSRERLRRKLDAKPIAEPEDTGQEDDYKEGGN